MKLLSMIDFVLKQGELFKQDGQSQRINLICNYANFMKHQINRNNFKPDHPECIFKNFNVDYRPEFTKISLTNDHGFELIYDTKYNVFLNHLCDPIVLNVFNFHLFCKGFGVEYKIELTDYAIKHFNLK